MTSHELAGPSRERGHGRDAEEFLREVGEVVRDGVAELRPQLRGWLHATAAPLALLSLIAVLAVAEPGHGRTGAAVFLATAVLMFTTSAVLHTRGWSARAETRWRRLDHANIFVLIAGSSTPFALTILDPAQATELLVLVWTGALLGIAFKVVWLGAPRGLSVGLYIALGSVALLYAPAFVQSGPQAVVLLLGAGGALYVLGALVYGFRWPDPAPSHFGFHEVFHALTVIAFAAHCMGVGLLVLA